MKRIPHTLIAICMAFTFAFISAQFAFAEETVTISDLPGKKDGNHYINRAIGIEAQFPEDWMILGDAAAELQGGVFADGSDTAALEEQLKNGGGFNDLYAMATNNGDDVMIILQDLQAVGLDFDDEKTIVLFYLMNLEKKLSAAGAEDVKTKYLACEFAGAEHSSIKSSMNRNGSMLYQRIVLIKVGQYLTIVTITSQDETRAEEILTLFKAATPEEANISEGEAFGKIEGNVYENEMIGIRAVFPEDWTILSEEAALELIGGGMEKIEYGDLSEFAEEVAPFIDLYAISTRNWVDNMNVQLERIDVGQEGKLTEEIIIAQEESALERDFIAAGAEDVQLSRNICIFAGDIHRCLDAKMKMSGVSLYERILFLVKDNYLVTITSFSASEDGAKAAFDFFEAA